MKWSTKKSRATRPAIASEQPRPHRFRVGDIVVINPNVSDRGGTVVAIFGNLIVFREADGNFDAWNADDVKLIAGCVSEPADAPIRADEFDDGSCVDARGVPIQMGDRVEIVGWPGGGHVVAIAGDQLILVNDWDEGHAAVGAFVAIGSDQTAQRHSRPAGTLASHVALLKGGA